MKEPGVILACNDKLPLDSKYLKYPLYASRKYDGHRCLLKSGQWLTRSFKTHVNKNIPEYFAKINEYSKKHKIVFDGELYAHELSFNQIQSVLRGYDVIIPPSVKYYIFDCATETDWYNKKYKEPYKDRLSKYLDIIAKINDDKIIAVENLLVSSPEEAETFYNKALEDGFEGMILRGPNGIYKHNRATKNENIMFKYKNFDVLDATIIEVIPRKQMKQDLERSRDALGHLVKTYKQENYETVENDIGAFKCETSDGVIFTASFGQGFTEEIRKELAKENLIGKQVEVLYTSYNQKTAPRFPKVIRIHEDR